MTLNRCFRSYIEAKQVVLLLMTFGLIFLSAACGEAELSSFWKDRDIVIDGKSGDWLDALYYFEEDDVSVGFFNDSEYLYICLLAEDYSIQRQVVMQGFTLWLDATGGKEKTFGIKFPLGMVAMGRDRMPTEMSDERPDRERMEELQRERPDPEMIRKAFEQTLDELEILGPGKDERKRIKIEGAEGLEIRVRNETGLLTYELKVPLQSLGENSYAIGATPGALIGVGLEVPKPDMDEMRDMMNGRGGGMTPGGGQPGGRPPGGGQPGGMGGGKGGGRGGKGRGGGSRPRMPDGLKIWAKLQLASPRE
ncbi:hypothetical protein ACFLT2_06650 [Acidobacteriota bacterium]